MFPKIHPVYCYWMSKFDYNNPPVEFLLACPKYLLDVYKNNRLFNSKISSETKPYECMNLYSIIMDNRLTKTLEIGMAQGFSAAWITKAHKDLALNGTHSAIDPYQKSQWKGIGLALLKKCDLMKNFKLLEMVSYKALPALVDFVSHSKFDLIYIDGFHTFDYTLVDFFYSNLILKIGGFIVIDDAHLLPVKVCIDYIMTNYSHYIRVDSVETQAVFKKVSEDKRPDAPDGWKYHKRF